MRQLFPILLISVSLLSCGHRQMPTAGEKGDTLRFKYAQLIEVVRHQGYTEVNIKNPWKEGKILHRYQLVSHSAAEMPDAANQATVVRIPLQRSVIFTSVHAALMQQLGGEDQVAGVADLKYMKVPFVQEGVQQGRIMDCGDGMSPLVEKIIDTQADGILLSPFENSGGYGRLEEINIPLIECAEYMEQSPLARAEWVRFYGILYGKEHEADSLFALVDSSYQALKAQVSEDAGIANGSAQSKRSNPLVLMDKQTGSVWYVPGGRSTIGRMLQDAQCRYPFATDEHSGSLPLSFETILEKCGDADVWLLRYDSNKPITRRQLLNEQPGYTQLRPAQTGEIYGCNVQTSMFYEESPFRPDLLLQDFIHILHPDIPNLPPLRYYQKLEN